MCASKEKLFLKEFDHLYAAATYFLYKSVPNHLVYTPKSWLKVSANVNWDKLWRYKPFLSHLTANFCMKKFVFFFLTFSPLFPSFFFYQNPPIHDLKSNQKLCHRSCLNFILFNYGVRNSKFLFSTFLPSKCFWESFFVMTPNWVKFYLRIWYMLMVSLWF